MLGTHHLARPNNNWCCVLVDAAEPGWLVWPPSWPDWSTPGALTSESQKEKRWGEVATLPAELRALLKADALKVRVIGACTLSRWQVSPSSPADELSGASWLLESCWPGSCMAGRAGGREFASRRLSGLGDTI